ncbi:hypothetical protein NKR74_23845 [Bacillus sp. 3103sda1]|uniref:SH3 domain-containing protein n=1 Tax=Bacillus sp. 3103sda1 TaxID=2953808 RepID=UPI00209FC4EF|nr:hypothetical protein [Bacillus sp. 3103sda1]MCP1126291.1 hypothetical protein [Bacillus sp. 3103sda1]
MTVSIGRVYIQGLKINVRTGPGLGYQKIRQVNQPDTFLVSQEQHGWLELEGNNEWIYYDKSYIKFLKNTEKVDPPGIATIQGIGVNVRKGPSKNYDVVKQLNKTDAITQYAVYKVFNGWLNLGGDQWIYYDPSYISYNK